MSLLLVWVSFPDLACCRTTVAKDSEPNQPVSESRAKEEDMELVDVSREPNASCLSIIASSNFPAAKGMCRGMARCRDLIRWYI